MSPTMATKRICKHCGSPLVSTRKKRVRWLHITAPLSEERSAAWRTYAANVRARAMADVVGLLMTAWVKGLFYDVHVPQPDIRQRLKHADGGPRRWARVETINVPPDSMSEVEAWRQYARARNVALGPAVAAVVDAWVREEEQKSVDEQIANFLMLRDVVIPPDEPASAPVTTITAKIRPLPADLLQSVRAFSDYVRFPADEVLVRVLAAWVRGDMELQIPINHSEGLDLGMLDRVKDVVDWRTWYARAEREGASLAAVALAVVSAWVRRLRASPVSDRRGVWDRLVQSTHYLDEKLDALAAAADES